MQEDQGPTLITTLLWSPPHKNGVVTLAPFLLHERGTHSSSCPVVKRISNAFQMPFSKIQNVFHELNHLGFIKNVIKLNPVSSEATRVSISHD